MSKKDQFALKEVTINFVLREDERGIYYDVFTTNDRSPIYYPRSDAEEVATIFSKWLKNTLEAMPKNNCTIIRLAATWN